MKTKSSMSFILRNIAKIEYVKQPGKIYLTHTEVPESLEGKGIGSALVRQVLEDIREKGLILVPLCPFVAAYISQHPEYQILVKANNTENLWQPKSKKPTVTEGNYF